MGRFLRQLGLVLALLIGVALLLDPLFTHLFKNGKGMKSQWIEQMHNEHFDVAIIGSSRALWNINTISIDTICGIRAINLANNHLTPSEILLTVEVFLRNGNTADRLLLQVDHATLSTDAHHFSTKAYEYVPFLDDTLVYEHLRAQSAEWVSLRYVPFWRYVKYNFKWGLEQAIYTALDRSPEPFDSTGGYFSPNEQFYEKGNVPYRPAPADLNSSLERVIALCSANGTELIPFTAPYFGWTIPDSAKHYPAQLLTQHGLRLVDFSDSLREQRFFNDHQHINRAGGLVFTRMLMQQVICPEDSGRVIQESEPAPKP